MNKQIAEWAVTYVPQFNALSEKYKASYYTQSPLDKVEEDVEEMIIGINPGGPLSNGKTIMSPEEFLRGNPKWEERFVDGFIKWRFQDGVRHFLGYDKRRHEEGIDNDSKVVWANLSPFQSKNGFTDLPKELKEIGIRSTIDLVKAVRPKRVIFSGGNAFAELDKYKDSYADGAIEHIKVFDNLPFEVGRIFDVPAVFVSHASSRSWPLHSHYFISVFVFFHKLAAFSPSGKPRPLYDVYEDMRKEVKRWQEGIVMVNY